MICLVDLTNLFLDVRNGIVLDFNNLGQSCHVGNKHSFLTDSQLTVIKSVDSA